MQDLLSSWSFRFCPWGRLSHPLFLISCSVDCCAALEQEAETAIMVIPAIPKRMFLRKLISLLSNWETQTEICHGSALGAAAGLIPLILSALITKHLCSCEQHFAPAACVLPINLQHSWVCLMHNVILPLKYLLKKKNWGKRSIWMKPWAQTAGPAVSNVRWEKHSYAHITPCKVYFQLMKMIGFLTSHTQSPLFSPSPQGEWGWQGVRNTLLPAAQVPAQILAPPVVPDWNETSSALGRAWKAPSLCSLWGKSAVTSPFPWWAHLCPAQAALWAKPWERQMLMELGLAAPQSPLEMAPSRTFSKHVCRGLHCCFSAHAEE